MKRFLQLGLLLWLTIGMVAIGCAAPEDFILTEEDCYEDETYVEEDQYCYLTCELDGTCAENPGILSFLGDFLSGLGNIVFGAPEDANVLITYDIENDKPTNPVEGEPQTDEEFEIVENTDSHQVMWQEFANLIPAENRREITSYGLFTDGEENTMAYVEPNQIDPATWKIVMDAVDAKNKKEQQYTLIHEFGHVLTLNSDQVPFDQEASQDDAAYEEAQQACSRFFTGEGCANAGSYINAFFSAFWADIYNDLPQDEDALYEFYEQHQDRFVTDYAATNPGEDIAESWTHFVLNDKPTGSTMADDKVRFFYDYPELVTLRDKIRARLFSASRR